MNFDRAIALVGMSCLFVGMFGLWLSLFLGGIDMLSEEKIGEESVPCLDEYNRPFENEMCTKTIYCSKMGWAHDIKCKDALVSGDEQ